MGSKPALDGQASPNEATGDRDANGGGRGGQFSAAPGPSRANTRAPFAGPSASVLRHYSELAQSEISVEIGLLQRILLTTDGTVTHILEAFMGEPVEVVKISQTVGPCDPADRLNALAPREQVMRRSVMLRGQWSGRNLLHGDSVIAYDRVPPPIRTALLTTGKGIGRLLFEHQLETFREIVGWGEEPAGPLAAPLGLEADAVLLFRTYRIMCLCRPIMWITEKFPASTFIGDSPAPPAVAAVAAVPTADQP